MQAARTAIAHAAARSFNDITVMGHFDQRFSVDRYGKADMPEITDATGAHYAAWWSALRKSPPSSPRPSCATAKAPQVHHYPRRGREKGWRVPPGGVCHRSFAAGETAFFASDPNLEDLAASAMPASGILRWRTHLFLDDVLVERTAAARPAIVKPRATGDETGRDHGACRVERGSASATVGPRSLA